MYNANFGNGIELKKVSLRLVEEQVLVLRVKRMCIRAVCIKAILKALCSIDDSNIKVHMCT